MIVSLIRGNSRQWEKHQIIWNAEQIIDKGGDFRLGIVVSCWSVTGRGLWFPAWKLNNLYTHSPPQPLNQTYFPPAAGKLFPAKVLKVDTERKSYALY